MIKQAREYCENFQNRKIPIQTVEGYLDLFKNPIEFSACSPVKSITSIKYTDMDGIERTVSPSDYILDNVSFVNKIQLARGKSWPSVELQPVNGVKVTFVAGYDIVPETVKWAMVLHMQLFYDDHTPFERDRIERARDALLSLNRVIPV